MNQTDEYWMGEAIKLAENGIGLTRPNPPVGAVVVKGGKLVGKGFHRKAGKAHAEKSALDSAGVKNHGATLYVTLEPCSTEGKTAACTEAILNAGIKKIIVSTVDPNPRHKNRGLNYLKAHGIKTITGVLEKEGKKLIEPFTKWITTGRPFLTLKMGMTVDGRIADEKGCSRWITSNESRKYVQELRRSADAILIGSQTALKDNPHLIPTPQYNRKPYRIVLDTHGSLPTTLKIFTDKHSQQTLWVLGKKAPKKIRQIEKNGVQFLQIPTWKGKISLPSLMESLGEMGILHLLCEGGGKLAGNLIREKLVDEYFFFMAPAFMGNGKVALDAPSWKMPQIPRFKFQEINRVGVDLLLRWKNIHG